MSGATALLLVLLGQAATSVPPASNADFPRYDRAAWDLQRAGLTAKPSKRSNCCLPRGVPTKRSVYCAALSIGIPAYCRRSRPGASITRLSSPASSQTTWHAGQVSMTMLPGP